jgi:hypothetical protein
MNKLIKVRCLESYADTFIIGNLYDAIQRSSERFDLVEDPLPTYFPKGKGEYCFNSYPFTYWEKLPFNTKVLSDDAIAKINMIVYCDYHKEICKILQIGSSDSNMIVVSSKRGWINKNSPTGRALFVYTEETRKATSEERKQYYKSLNP